MENDKYAIGNIIVILRDTLDSDKLDSEEKEKIKTKLMSYIDML